MTNGWTDIRNADVVLAMGGNPAENHPVGFRFVMDAKRNRQFLDLAGRFRVVGVDLRGHGRSTLGSEPIGPHRLASDLASVLQQRDLRGVVVVGHSLGGTVVGQLCADHPDVVRERVAGLVFVGTFASAVAGEGRFRELVSPTMVRLTAKLRAGSNPKERPSSGAFRTRWRGRRSDRARNRSTCASHSVSDLPSPRAS